MNGSAQLEIQPEEGHQTFALETQTLPGHSMLKQEVAEKLAQHRQRRARMGVEAAVEARNRSLNRPGPVTSPVASAAGSPAKQPAKQRTVAAAVAERYAQTPSYRAFLAQEAERALLEAAAAAEIAQRNAVAVAAVQQELLAELEKYDAPQFFTPQTAAVVVTPRPDPDVPVKQLSTAAGLTVKLYEDLGRAIPAPRAVHPAGRPVAVATGREADELEEEIAFRQAPVFEEYHPVEPATPIPANLLEFPRQLVATIKARPTLALGPLREEPGTRPGQLRIFEVEPDQIAFTPLPASLVPEWHDIFLDAHTVTQLVEDPDAPAPEILPSLLPPQTAPVQLRLMATAVDAALILAGFVAAIAAFARVVRLSAGSIAPAMPLALAGIVTLAMLYLAYQFLFFTLTDQTPGMRYARIGLCTFTDENPTRHAMRKRILAQLVAAAPLGLGLAWILLDEDRLGWHDRISRMYLRAY